MSDATQIVIDVCYCLAGGCIGFFFGLVYAARQERHGRHIGDPRS